MPAVSQVYVPNGQRTTNGDFNATGVPRLARDADAQFPRRTDPTIRIEDAKISPAENCLTVGIAKVRCALNPSGDGAIRVRSDARQGGFHPIVDAVERKIGVVLTSAGDRDVVPCGNTRHIFFEGRDRLWKASLSLETTNGTAMRFSLRRLFGFITLGSVP